MEEQHKLKPLRNGQPIVRDLACPFSDPEKLRSAIGWQRDGTSMADTSILIFQFATNFFSTKIRSQRLIS